MLFADASLARRIERAEVDLVLEGARASARRLDDGPLIVESNGGAAVFVEAGSPFNKIVGWGFDGVPPADVLDTIEREYAQRRAPLQAEIATLADPQVARTLSRRGYELVGFENVLALAIAGNASERWPMPAGIEVVRTAAEPDAEWISTVTRAFLNPDTFDGPPSHESFAHETLARVYGDMVAAPGFERYLAMRDGSIAGGATFRIQDGVAQLCGAGTLPDHRRRGVQTALLRHRLHQAAARGCSVAVVTTQPGSPSQQNVQKAGFELLYARAILVRDWQG